MKLTYACLEAELKTNIVSNTTGVVVQAIEVTPIKDTNVTCIETNESQVPIDYPTYHKITATCTVIYNGMTGEDEFTIEGNSEECSDISLGAFLLEDAVSDTVTVTVYSQSSSSTVDVSVKLINNKNKHVYMD